MLAEGLHQPPRNERLKILEIFLLVAVSMLALGLLHASPAAAVGNIDSREDVEGHDLEPDRDFRAGSVQPSRAQRNAVSNLGATARWNRFGTPQSLIRYGRFLATNVQGSNAQEAARNFLANNARVFGLSSGYLSGADSLWFVNDSPMEDTNGHAVFFRQQFGDLPAIKDGSVIVGG